MDPQTKRTLRYFEKLVQQDDWHPHKTKYMQVYPAARAYYMSRDRLINRAIKAGAYYDLGDIVLINTRGLDDYLLKTGELIICKDDPGEEHEFFRKAKDDDPDWNLDKIFGEDLEETDDSSFDSEEFLRIDSDRIINAVNLLAEKRVEMHNSSGYLDSVLFNVATATEVKEIMDNGGMYNPYTDTVVGR